MSLVPLLGVMHTGALVNVFCPAGEKQIQNCDKLGFFQTCLGTLSTWVIISLIGRNISLFWPLK